MTYEVSYEFPLGTGKIVRRNVTASTEQEALRVAGVNNTTLKARISPDEINRAHVEALKEEVQRNRKRGPNGGPCEPVFLAHAVKEMTRFQRSLLISNEASIACTCPVSPN